MYNFNNLSDFEFEMLCRDIMQKKLGIELYTFQKGRDGGIDITDNPVKKTVIIQVKHYINSKYSNLISSLRKEVGKVQELKPQRYYVCCAVKLTASNKQEIYSLFSDYMESANDVMSLLDINAFLEDQANMNIVRKHYKLWLESTNILSEIYNQSVFIDCESLLYNIEEESKEFVATGCYYDCLNILDQERMLLLLGMPGTGKTVTTKMIALYYASKGYSVRYTTNGNIRDLKNALSVQKDQMEIVLLDDCLGQHYFKMKEKHGDELLGLVKYIAMYKNKKLIMNSRVTIFKQAKECFSEFRKFAEDEKFKIKILDMGKISLYDKGRIFHNHIYFKRLPEIYYQDIIRNNNYRKVVMHRNYTPRIMEFVTREFNYKDIPGEEYFNYVMKCLDNPTEIWHDEFSEKLQQEDRVFMTTLYSLTDTSIDAEALKKAFNHRLSHSVTIDTSKNIWEDVLKRLEGSFILIIEKNDREEVGVINPSVNDFLKEYLMANDLERKNIKDNAIDYKQIKRGFARRMEDIVQVGEANLLNYSSLDEELFVILSYVCRQRILNNNYRYAVEKFYELLPYGVFEGMMNRCELFIILLSQEFCGFYNTYSCIDEISLSKLFWNMDLDEYQILILTAQKYKVDFFYNYYYKEIFIEAINDAISEYMEDIYIDSYAKGYDVNELIKQNMNFNGYFEELDKESVVSTIYQWIQDDVEQEVLEKINGMPKEVLTSIKIASPNVVIADVECFVESYLEPPELEYDHHENEYDYGRINEMEILDCIFK